MTLTQMQDGKIMNQIFPYQRNVLFVAKNLKLLGINIVLKSAQKLQERKIFTFITDIITKKERINKYEKYALRTYQ